MDRLPENAFICHQPAIALYQHIATCGCACLRRDQSRLYTGEYGGRSRGQWRALSESRTHRGGSPCSSFSATHGDDPSGSSFPYTKQAEPVGSTLWWSGQDSYLWSRKATNPLGLSVRLRRTAAADLKDQARQLLLGQLRNGRLAALPLATLPCSVRLRLAASRTAGARQGDKPFGFVGSASPNCRRLI